MEFGHVKADCKKFAAWSIENKNWQHQKEGKPPCVPKPKPAYSLEPDEDCDYEVAGVMEESDDEDGDADAVDIEGGRDVECLFEGGRDGNDNRNNGCVCDLITDGSGDASSPPDDDGRVPEIRRYADCKFIGRSDLNDCKLIGRSDLDECGSTSR